MRRSKSASRSTCGRIEKHTRYKVDALERYSIICDTRDAQRPQGIFADGPKFSLACSDCALANIKYVACTSAAELRPQSSTGSDYTMVLMCLIPFGVTMVWLFTVYVRDNMQHLSILWRRHISPNCCLGVEFEACSVKPENRAISI